MRAVAMRGVLSETLRPSRRAGLLAALVLVAQLTSGCLSNEYRIPRQELQRLAELPPHMRGQRVRVVQKVGDRRSNAIDPEEVTRAYEQSGPPYADGEGRLDIDININGGRSGSGGWGRTSSFRGSPPSGGSHGGMPSGGGGWRGGGGGGLGGGGDGGDALVVLALVLVGVALVATIALVAGEGSRYDGEVQMLPDHPLHVLDASGQVTDLPLGMLSRADAAVAVEATVMDDEGLGLRRLDRAPLDRRGMAFKLDLGSTAFSHGPSDVVGPAAHIQIGGFFTQRLGLMVDVGLSGGAGCCGGETVTRHSLALELQAFPVSLGRLHLGAFAQAGVALAGTPGLRQEGPIAGGGALVEVDLTTRMALTLRGAATMAQLGDRWSSAETLTGGLAIY